MNNPDVLRSNRRALLLIVLGIVLSLILLNMPLYSFNVNVYTKKSPNTFVGESISPSARRSRPSRRNTAPRATRP